MLALTGLGLKASVNEVLAQNLHKPVIKKFKISRVYARFKDNNWAADLAEMRSLSSKNRDVKYLLCTKYILFIIYYYLSFIYYLLFIAIYWGVKYLLFIMYLLCIIHFLPNMLLLNLWKIKKAKTVCYGFLGIVNKSNHKPKKLWVDQAK